jgi:hypothetical protein
MMPYHDEAEEGGDAMSGRGRKCREFMALRVRAPGQDVAGAHRKAVGKEVREAQNENNGGRQ